MTGGIEPVRFHLTAAELAAAFELAGRSPAPGANVPPASAGGKAAKVLAGTGTLAGGGLLPSVTAAIDAIAAPVTMTVITGNRAGNSRWNQTSVLVGSAAVVVLARSGEAFDIASVPGLDEAVVVVDELLELNAFPATSGDGFDLDEAGFVALVATSDALRSMRLRAQLDRRALPGGVVLSRDEIVAAAETGLATSDSRWAVTAAARTSPGDLAAAAARIDDGLAGLVAAGVVQPSTGGWTPTADGIVVLDTLTRLVGSGSLVSIRPAASTIGTATMTVLRAADAIWLGAWARGGAGLSVRVRRASQAGALSVVRSVLTHHAEAAPTASWQATHRVPDVGAWAWAAPDAATEPAAPLDPRLPVRVDSRQGDWAAITCSNGWQAWVDARVLEEIR